MASTPSARTPWARHFLAPRYWPTWIGLAALRCVARLPYRWQLGIGRLIGRVMQMLLPRRRRIAATNLRLCFPTWTERRRAELLSRHFESLGISLVETAMGWWTKDEKLQPLGNLRGLEHLNHALSLGKGAVLLCAHFTTLEIGSRLLLLAGTRFHAMYRTHRNPLFESVMKRAREKHCEKAIASDDVRGLLRSLKENVPVWYASDQNYGHKHSVFAPFFGIPAATNLAPVRLAKISGAPVIPFFIERLPAARGYRLSLLPALQNFPSDDAAADILCIHHLIEEHIAKVPEQYLWVHRRFKDRPPGQPDFYKDTR